MDVDGTRTRHGSLTSEERRRRSDAGLCAYCGAVDHQIATCPRAAHIRQARGTFPHFTALPTPLAGYQYPPTGYQYPPGFPYPLGPFLGPWNLLPKPQTSAPSAGAAAAAADMPKNSHPSQ